MSDLGAPPTGPEAGVTEPEIRPSKAGYWIGTVILVLGCGAGFVWLILAAVSVGTRADDYERIPIPGERRLEFTSAARYTFFAETTSQVYGGDLIVEPDVEIRAADGTRVGTDIPRTTFTYNTSNRHGQSFAEVRIPSPGVYDVSVTAGRGTGVRPVRVAVGRSTGAGDFTGIFGALVLMTVAFFVGLILLIATGVRRGRAKRALAPVPPIGPPPGYGYGTPPPPPGYGYGTPPPPPGYGYGTPPPPPGYGYGTPPPPPGYGTPPPPPAWPPAPPPADPSPPGPPPPS